MTTEQQIEILITENQELQKKVEQLQFELKAADSDYHYKTKALIDEIEEFKLQLSNEQKRVRTILVFKQPTEKQVDGEIEAVEFAEWCDKQVTYIDENGNVDYKQLYEIFKNR